MSHRPRAKPLTPGQSRIVCAAYARGATVAELARRLGSSRYCLERPSCWRTSNVGRPRSGNPRAGAARIRELAARGLSLRKIGAVVGRSHRFVWLVLNRPRV